MNCFSKWLCAAVVVVSAACSANAAESVAGGVVKSVDAEKKTFVFTDSNNKDFSVHMGDKFVVNRDGKESNAGLKAGDSVYFSYEKSKTPWVARYVLVQDDASKDCSLVRGVVKAYDSKKSELTFTNETKSDVIYSTADAKIRLAGEDDAIENVKIGDGAIAVVKTVNGKSTVKILMVDRSRNEK